MPSSKVFVIVYYIQATHNKVPRAPTILLQRDIQSTAHTIHNVTKSIHKAHLSLVNYLLSQST